MYNKSRCHCWSTYYSWQIDPRTQTEHDSRPAGTCREILVIINGTSDRLVSGNSTGVNGCRIIQFVL